MGSSPCRAWPQRRHASGLQSVIERTFSGGTKARGLAMTGLPAPLPPARWRGGLAFQPDRVGRRGLGGIGGVELEPGLEIADALLQLSDLLSERVEDGQDGDLGVRWDSVPERSRDGRLKDHARDTTKLLYKRFDP